MALEYQGRLTIKFQNSSITSWGLPSWCIEGSTPHRKTLPPHRIGTTSMTRRLSS